MKTAKTLLVLSTLVPLCGIKAQPSLQKLFPVNFSQVEITDPFWKGRMQTVATLTGQLNFFV